MLSEGDQAPALMATLSDGSSLDIGAPGQPLVLFFYPKDMTPGCTTEAMTLLPWLIALRRQGRESSACRAMPWTGTTKFIARHDLKVPLASDHDGAISDAFGTWGLKSFMGRKFMGMIRSTFLVGADGRILRAWPKVKVKGHAHEVLEAVSAL